jgi:hypothetical protein
MWRCGKHGVGVIGKRNLFGSFGKSFKEYSFQTGRHEPTFFITFWLKFVWVGQEQQL